MDPNPLRDSPERLVDEGSKSLRTAAHFARVKERTAQLEREIAGVVTTDRKITWEVGCGHGHFLTAYAKEHPGEICIGIDIVRDRIERALRKKTRAKLERVHFLIAEAQEFLAGLSPDIAFSSIFVLFPDPWPKRRHHKNRLLSSSFLDAIARRAGKGTRFYFRTDFEPYFLEVAALVRTHSQWEIADEPWPLDVESVFQARAPHYFSLVARPAVPVP